MSTSTIPTIVGAKLSALQDHLSKYVGDEMTDLLAGDYTYVQNNHNNYYSYDFLEVIFLNTDQTKVEGFVFEDDNGEFLFIIRGTTGADASLNTVFPIYVKPDPSNPNQPIDYRSILPPTTIGSTTWRYMFFSTDDTKKQSDLWDLYQTSISSIETIDFDRFMSLLEIENQYATDRQISTPAGGTPTPPPKWQGGLYFNNKISEWPFGFIRDEAGFFGLLTNAAGFNFYTTGGVFYPEYGDRPFINPVFHCRVPLAEKKYSGSFVSKMALEVEFFSTSENSNEPVNVSLEGKIFLDDNKYEFDVIANWPLGNGSFEFSASCKINEIPFFDHTAIPGLEDASLEAEVITRISTADKSFQSSTVSVELDNWPIISDILALKELKFLVNIYDVGGGKKDFSARVDAKALLGQDHIQIDCGGAYPEGQFYFALDPSTPIHLAEVAEAFFGSHGGMDENLEITELSGNFNYVTKAMFFSIALEDSTKWKITDVISINNIRMTVGGNGAFYGSIDASFDIGVGNDAMTFSVDAEKDDGWSFEAKYDKGNSTGISLGSLSNNFDFNTPSLPSFLSSLTIDHVDLYFKSGGTGKTDKRFELSGTDIIDGAKVVIELKLEITYTGGVEKITFSGHLTVKDAYIFDIIQQKDGTGKVFLAAYHEENDDNKIDISDIMAGLGVSGVPSMNISLKDALFANGSNAAAANASFNLLVADLGVGMNLSNLPLVNKVLPANETLKLDLRVLYASDAYSASLDQINGVLPEGISSIAKPDPSKDKKGFDLIAELKLGGKKFHLELPIEIKDSFDKDNPISDKPGNAGGSPAAVSAKNHPNTPVPVDSGITWFNIGKKFGPVIFNRIGLTYKNNELTVYPDAGLNMAGLTFVLNGLSVSSPVTEFHPIFDLKGLGLDFKNGPLEIGAAFLKQEVIIDGETVNEYNGMAIIGAEVFSLSALGSYAYFNGHPSLFIYAYLDAALGGPSFFFVEGLAAGFGYNRSLLMPTIDQVSTFPLVRQVMSGDDPTAAGQDTSALLSQQLEALGRYIPPTSGQMFLAVGIKFNSFELIDSFVLLAVSFGQHFEIDVLGQSDVIVPSETPPDVPPLAEIKIQLMARFIPDEGVLAVQAQLTNDSYIFAKDCHLTGGAAFYAWFKGQHEGDFVVTMGGYHPLFKIPSHYPRVPRLGLNWQISSAMSVKGDMYFALCPHAFMAGGHLEALYEEGHLRAWFKAGADFIISWQPYFYDAHLYLDLGASYTYHFFGTHHITIDIGADIHLWGPKFAGKARLHIWVVSVSVKFGPQGNTSARPIDWDAFKSKCIPSPEKIISAVIVEGKHNEDNNVPIVNPTELQIKVSSEIPISSFDTVTEKGNPFGLAPMDVTNDIVSHQEISIKKDGSPISDEEKKNIVFTPIEKKMPSAVWGMSFSQDLNSDKRTVELTNGLNITAVEPIELPKGGIDFVSLDTLLDKSHSPINLEQDIDPLDYSYVTDQGTIDTYKDNHSDFKMLCSDMQLEGMPILTQNS